MTARDGDALCGGALRTMRRCAFVAFGAVILSGCSFLGTDPSRTWFEVANRTGEPLDISYDRGNGMILARDVPPGAKVNVDNPAGTYDAHA